MPARHFVQLQSIVEFSILVMSHYSSVESEGHSPLLSTIEPSVTSIYSSVESDPSRIVCQRVISHVTYIHT